MGRITELRQPLNSAVEVDSTNQEFYTAGQVKTIVQQAVELALQKHLDSSIPQLSPTVTVAEAAQIIRISKPSMYELIRSDQVRSIRIGKKYLVSRQSLHDLVEGSKQA